MRQPLRGFATWRRLGARRGTAVALAVLSAPARARFRRARLRVRPPRVSPRALARALGYVEPQIALRERALPALPTVARWEQELDALDAGAQTRLLERAEQILAHRFDLLGSGTDGSGAGDRLAAGLQVRTPLAGYPHLARAHRPA